MRVLLILLLALIATAGVLGQKKDAPFAPGELLVKLKPGKLNGSASVLRARHNLVSAESLGATGWNLVRFSNRRALDEVAAKLAKDNDIEAVQPNFYYNLTATPNDPQFGSLWGMPKISAPAAWDTSTGSSDVVVAVIDTGIRYTHEDLAANIWTNPGEIPGNGIDDEGNGFADDFHGYDFYFNDPDPADEHGHGAHVAGTIGATGNNSVGVVGVNWNVRLMAIKIYDATPTDTTSAMLINAYNYIRMMKQRGVNIRVTNNSYAGCAEACGFDQATKDAIDALGDAGILNVFAAGNNAWNNDTAAAPAYPAAYDSPSILAVAGSNETDAKVSSSNWGPTSVDIAAPGARILSTGKSNDSHYHLLSGTSMAAPHVSGAAALLASLEPSLSAASLKATLMNSVDPLSGWEGTATKTNGRLNVAAALQSPTLCNFVLSTDTINFGRKGGYVEVSVSAPANCDYSVRENSKWLIAEGPSSRSGNSIVKVWLSINRFGTREATLRIADQAVMIRQARP